jgi:NTE family protein
VASRDYDLALVLSGGNALGAFQAGAYQAMHETGFEPDWIAGASSGAINGAIICGNPADRRIERLRALWAVSEAGSGAEAQWGVFEDARRTNAVVATLAAGHPALFVPRNLLGPWWNPFGNREPASLYDLTPLERTLETLVDFDLLNRGATRLSVTAVDIGNGQDVVFDTHTHRLTPAHLRASAALLPAFSPVEIEGRLLGDAGISANLPLDALLAEPGERPLLCIALDLLPLAASPPRTLGETVSRTQDLIFATQSRRAIAAWQAIFDERGRSGESRAVTLLHIAYADQSREVSGKASDFSPASTAQRWQAGHDQLTRAIAQLRDGGIALGQPGLTTYRTPADPAGPLETVRWPIGPVSG